MCLKYLMNSNKRKIIHLNTAITFFLMFILSNKVFRERILKTIKQLNNYFNFIWTNRNVELKLYLLPIGRNRFV